MECRTNGSNQVIDEWTNAQAYPITPEQASWLAGFSDAEASFTMLGAKSANLRYVLYNNNEQLLKYAQSLVGGTLTKVLRTQRSEKHNDSYMLTCTSFSDTCRACLTLEPYLRLKQEQAQLLLRSANMKPEQRIVLRERIQELNMKAVQIAPEMYGAVKGGQRDLKAISQRDWAYLAGWLDGDGSFSFQGQGGNTYWYPAVIVCSSKIPILFTLQEIFGGNVNIRRQKENWAPKGELRFQDQKYTFALLVYLIPHLQGKRAQAQLMLESSIRPASKRREYRDKLMEMNGRMLEECA